MDETTKKQTESPLFREKSFVVSKRHKNSTRRPGNTPRSALLCTRIEIWESAHHFGLKLECSERKNGAAAKTIFATAPFSSLSRTFGGDKRDRTADLLNAIDGRGSVHQGYTLQKEKPLKYKGFLLICPFRTLYFSASCALEFLNRLRVYGAVYSPISFTLR